MSTRSASIFISGPPSLVKYLSDALQAIDCAVETTYEMETTTKDYDQHLKQLEGTVVTISAVPDTSPRQGERSNVTILDASEHDLYGLFDGKWHKGAMINRSDDPHVEACARRVGWDGESDILVRYR